MDFSRAVVLYGPKEVRDTAEHSFSVQIPEDGMLSWNVQNSSFYIMVNGVRVDGGTWRGHDPIPNSPDFPVFKPIPVLKGDIISGDFINEPGAYGFVDYPLVIYLTPYRTN